MLPNPTIAIPPITGATAKAGKPNIVASRAVAAAIESVIECERIGISVIGLEVPHAHIHLIPIENMEDISFKKKVTLDPEEMQKIASAIASYLI